MTDELLEKALSGKGAEAKAARKEFIQQIKDQRSISRQPDRIDLLVDKAADLAGNIFKLSDSIKKFKEELP